MPRYQAPDRHEVVLREWWDLQCWRSCTASGPELMWPMRDGRGRQIAGGVALADSTQRAIWKECAWREGRSTAAGWKQPTRPFASRGWGEPVLPRGASVGKNLPGPAGAATEMGNGAHKHGLCALARCDEEGRIDAIELPRDGAQRERTPEDGQRGVDRGP